MGTIYTFARVIIMRRHHSPISRKRPDIWKRTMTRPTSEAMELFIGKDISEIITLTNTMRSGVQHCVTNVATTVTEFLRYCCTGFSTNAWIFSYDDFSCFFWRCKNVAFITPVFDILGHSMHSFLSCHVPAFLSRHKFWILGRVVLNQHKASGTLQDPISIFTDYLGDLCWLISSSSSVNTFMVATPNLRQLIRKSKGRRNRRRTRSCARKNTPSFIMCNITLHSTKTPPPKIRSRKKIPACFTLCRGSVTFLSISYVHNVFLVFRDFCSSMLWANSETRDLWREFQKSRTIKENAIHDMHKQKKVCLLPETQFSDKKEEHH